MMMEDCIFCNLHGRDKASEEYFEIIGENECFYIVEDKYPVSPGHILIVSKQHRKDYFDLTYQEVESLPGAIYIARELMDIVLGIDPDGYNIGMNCGLAAGQTVMHFHCHFIPRYEGDMEDPRGGVRGVIPDKQKY